MIPRALWGLAIGGTVGGLYGAFGRCVTGQCAIDWNPTVPTLAGAGVGLFLVLVSKWD